MMPIKVEDELPKHEQKVLCFTENGCAVCIFVDTKEMNKVLRAKGYPQEQWDITKKPYFFANTNKDGRVLKGVTHWMAIPQIPKD